MTNEQHNNYLAWTFVGHAAFQIFLTLIMMLFMSAAFWQPGDPRAVPPPAFFAMVYGFVIFFQLLFIIPSSIAAYALFKHKSWARTASIVAGVVSSMNVPFGSAACAYSLWFFLSENWKELYEPGRGKYAKTSDAADDQDRLRLVDERETRWTGIHTNEEGEVVFRQPQPPDWR